MFGFDEPDVPKILPEDVKKAIDGKKRFVLLDVRTRGEFARGKIAGSINLPVDEVSSKVLSVVPDKSALVYVYCLSGSRSSHAVETMVKLGYTNVFDMKQGMLAWRVHYFPVVP